MRQPKSAPKQVPSNAASEREVAASVVREGRGDEDGGEVGEKGVCVRRCRLVEVSTCVGRVVDLSGTCPGHVLDRCQT